MPALGNYVTAVTNQAALAFALPILGVAALISGIFWATGNPQAAKSWATGGLIGVGIILAIPQIVATLPKPA